MRLACGGQTNLHDKRVLLNCCSKTFLKQLSFHIQIEWLSNGQKPCTQNSATFLDKNVAESIGSKSAG